MNNQLNCQRCRQNLIQSSNNNNNKLEESSLNYLTKSSYELISNSISSSSNNFIQSQSNQQQQQQQQHYHLSDKIRPLYKIAATTNNNERQQQQSSKLNQVRIKSNLNNNDIKPLTNLGVEESFFLLTESSIRPARNATLNNNNNNQTNNNSPHSTNSLSNSTTTSSTTTTPLTPRLNQLQNLYNLLSSNNNLDYPLCIECMENLINLMEKELEEGKKQRDKLLLFEKEVNKKREEGVISRNVYEREINRLKKAEKQSLDELNLIESQRSILDQEKLALDLEESELAEEEAEFWKAHSKNLLTAATLRDKTNSLQTRYTHDVKELEKLQKTNVYNDAFCIGQENSFGTINGLRLGRLPNIPVEWPEINAAWGHTLLLLYTIARKFGLSLETYRLVPMGSFSRIEKLNGDKAVYELYGSGDFAVTRLLQNRRFDMAMVAFLDCLRQVMEFVKEKDSSVKLPHAVQKDRIGDVSIKLQFGSDEAWTRALRHVLLDLKILLGRASL